MIAENKERLELSGKNESSVVKNKQKNKEIEKNSIHNRLYMDSKYSRRLQRKNNLPIYQEKQISNINYGNHLYQQSKVASNNK